MLLSVVGSLVAVLAAGQTLPPSGQVTSVPATSRIGADGRIGSAAPRAATPGMLRGFCGKWVKFKGDEITDTAAKTVSILDNVNTTDGGARIDVPDQRAGDQSLPARRGRFFDRVTSVDFHDNVGMALSGPTLPFPWTSDVCRLQGLELDNGVLSSLGFQFGTRLRGNLHVDRPGILTFVVYSDDGYSLRIGETEVAAFPLGRAKRVDSRRVSFSEPGVYPIEMIYWDSGGEAALEVYMAPQAYCFPTSSLDNIEPGCASNQDISALPRATDVSAFLKVFSRLGFRQVDLPTWVEASSDAAFSTQDETCEAVTINTSCGQPASAACGDGVREKVNRGTAGETSFGDEQCDDGNRIDGDGCSSTCTTETGYNCSASPLSQCLPASPDDGGTTAPPDAGQEPQAPDAGRIGDGNSDGGLTPGSDPNVTVRRELQQYAVGCGCQEPAGLVELYAIGLLALLLRRRGARNRKAPH